MRTSSWFGGSEGRNADEAAFLTALRRTAEGWTHPDVDPEADSAVYEWFPPLYLVLAVPNLDATLDTLEITYLRSGPRGAELAGGWGNDGWPLDDTTEDLVVRGVAAGPQEMAGLAATWLDAQLRRTVRVEEWLDADGLAARRWVRDDGEVLGDTRRMMWRLRRRRPDRVTLLRGEP